MALFVSFGLCLTSLFSVSCLLNLMTLQPVSAWCCFKDNIFDGINIKVF